MVGHWPIVKQKCVEWCMPVRGQTTLFIIIINLSTSPIKEQPSKSNSADSHDEMNALIKWQSSIMALVLDATIPINLPLIDINYTHESAGVLMHACS